MSDSVNRGWGAAIGWLFGALALAIVTWLLVQPWIVIFSAKAANDFIVGRIREVSGWNFYLVQGIAVFALIPLGIALAEVIRFDVWGRITGRSRASRRSAQLVLVAYVGAYFLTMYFASRHANFAVVDGEAVAIKYCAQTPAGLRCSDAPGVDREFGLPLLPVSSAALVANARERLGDTPTALSVDDPDTFQFFDTLRQGRPRVWFGTNRAGAVEFFDAPGFHPTTGAELQPVTPQAIDAYRGQQRQLADAARQAQLDAQVASRKAQLQAEAADAERDRQSREASAAARRREFVAGDGDLRGKAVVAVVDENLRALPELSSALAAALGGQFGVLRQPFLSTPDFRDALAGSDHGVRALDLRSVSTLVVATATSSRKPVSLDPDLVSIEMTVAGWSYDWQRSTAPVQISLRAVGAGFSEQQARAKASAEVARQFASRLAVRD